MRNDCILILTIFKKTVQHRILTKLTHKMNRGVHVQYRPIYGYVSLFYDRGLSVVQLDFYTNLLTALHEFHNKITFYSKLHRASSFVALNASFLEGPAVESASLRPLANQERTYGKQSKFGKGGPTIDISIRDDRCEIVTVLLREVQMMFILLKARSHSAVLTGRVETMLIKFFKGFSGIPPRLSLKSR